MTDIIIIVIFWAICFIVAFVILPAWRRHHDAGAGLYARGVQENKILISNALKKLNCTYTWEEDHDDMIVKYDFQSGHFRIRLEKESPYVRLSYLFFFDTQLENLELVRNLCNQCNINSETCRVIYSTNEAKDTVDLHIICGLLLLDGMTQDILVHAMTGMFSWQNAYVKRFNEAIADNAKSETKDIERDNAEWNRELFLLREQEIMHQSAGPDWRQDVSDKITLKQLLATTLGLKDISPVSMMVSANGSVSSVNKEDVMEYDISTPIIAGGAFISDNALLSLTYTDPKRTNKERKLTVSINTEEATDDSLFYRITTVVIPVSVEPQVNFESSENRMHSGSVLVAYDLTSPKQRLDEFHYMWKEAMEKEKKGDTDSMTEEQQLISDCINPQLGYNLYRGRVLFGQKRFFEALLHLENAYHVMQAYYHEMKPAVKDKFFEICYLVGFCYCELQQYQQAYYYLEIPLPLRRITYTKEYINCLVNSGDFRVIDVIDSLIAETENAQDAQDEDQPQPEEHIVAFLNFLKRRKAYIYIDRRQYDDAEKMLKKMLDDPDNTDFAINELAYIQKMRGEN
jgi:tetratricopeptide (TPR) repeat protein